MRQGAIRDDRERRSRMSGRTLETDGVPQQNGVFWLRSFIFATGAGLIAVSMFGLIVRPGIGRTGRSVWNWRIAAHDSSLIQDAYYVMHVHPFVFVVLLLLGALACIYALRLEA